MYFLDTRRFCARHDDACFGATRKGRAILAGKQDDVHITSSCCFQSPANVQGSAARRERDQKIARATDRLYLSFENIFKRIIVADGGEGRSVGRECERAQRLALFLVPSNEFRGQVLAVSSRAAVAAYKDEAVALHCLLNKLGSALDRREYVSHTLCYDITMTLKRSGKNTHLSAHTSMNPTSKKHGLKDLHARVLPFRQIVKMVREAKAAGKRVVTSNGTFDIVHIGHVRNLAYAKKHGDMLIVGINSDSSVRRNKGPGRPINTARERAEVVAAMRSVDAVFIYNDLTPIPRLKVLRSHVHVKGADRSRGQLVERQAVESFGGKIVRVPYLKNKSTTGIIEQIHRTRS